MSNVYSAAAYNICTIVMYTAKYKYRFMMTTT